MAKFNFKTATKGLGTDAMTIGLTIGGAVISKKFLNFENIFKAQAAKAEKPFWIKQQGGIKLAGALIASNFVKNKFAKQLLQGVAFEGGLSLLRTVTTDKTGASFFEPIGQQDPDSIDETIESGVAGEHDYQDTVSGVGDDFEEGF